MKSKVYHGGKPEARHQLVQAIESIGLWYQKQTGTHAVVTFSVTVIYGIHTVYSGHFEHVVITLKLKCCKNLKW
jgi:uncharacterized membrane protein (DUF2068 family)